ncbi:MAG: aminoacyl-tRNA hydrolase [Proteobacteria bacterium]|nr:aminoacyl-tRNA hydrolase [Pseudomonadota bacterium]
MMLFVGLGNPGAEHAGQRHNIGFMAVDEIVRRHGFSSQRARFQGQTFEGRLADKKILMLKPMTYMNRSGQSVGEAMRYYKLEPRELIVFYDEIDFAPGKMKVKTGGGAAGHNGIRSLISHIGADFRRVRIGVGHPGNKDDVHRHVLSDFSKSEAVWRDPLIDAIAEEAPLLAAGEDARFMTAVALRLAPAKAKKKSTESSGAKT